MRKIGCLLFILALLLVSCSVSEKKYKIGISQCSADIWREQQNAELRMGAYFHDDVELRFAAAYDSDARQVQQIDSLVATGIDLLIVAPNQVATISPAIDRAYDKGIPVIVFERKTNSQKYTAFMSADNYEMGRTMGDFIARRLNGRGRVMEIKGLEGSSPAIERHNGFRDAMSRYPAIDIVATLQGDWTEESAVAAVKTWLQTPDGRGTAAAGIDYVFGQNDRMAMGARQALLEARDSGVLTLTAGAGGTVVKFCGIDGLTGEGGGIQLVRDSVLEASYIYPTHGDQLLQLAVDILDGKPYKKETSLMSALVTRDNARVLLMQNEEITQRSDYLERLHNKADEYLSRLDTQRMIIFLACGVIALLSAVIVLFYLYHRSKMAIRRERVVNTLWNMSSTESVDKPESGEKPGDPEPGTSTDSDVGSGVAQRQPSAGDTAPASSVPSVFLTRFREVVERRLDDSDLSIDELAADMSLSRVQLYRKVKSISGSSPVELLRTARLNRAYQLLLTTDKSVSEVAYAVGFTAPSYFTRCFKEEYGMVPGDVKR